MIFNQSTTELHDQSARSSNHVMQHALNVGTGEMRHYVLTYSSDIVVSFHTAVFLSC